MIGEETGKKIKEEIKMDCEITAEDIARDKNINHNHVTA